MVLEYISAQDAAIKWGITKRRVQILCSSNRIDNAVRIGNMWVLPSNAQKPTDARCKTKEATIKKIESNPIRVVRTKIKNLVQQGISSLIDNGYAMNDGKLILITVFASELLLYYINKQKNNSNYDENDVNDVLLSISKLTKVDVDYKSNIIYNISNSVRKLIKKYPFCCDDAISWCYQYANKLNHSMYCSTQFFTEKYMITSIVDNMRIQNRSKILDFACGGANFLIYCMDVLVDAKADSFESKKRLLSSLNSAYSKLYGYEIDPTLAIVAVINLKIKGISILTNNNFDVSLDEFEHFHTNVFYPKTETLIGALDVEPQKQVIINTLTNEEKSLQDIYIGTDTIITNPPFQTTKGMNEKLKSYLKTHYPLSKCDMCNSFIELSQKILTEGGIAGLVTQNSWMYLDSFITLRKDFLTKYLIESIVELGSNAFYDLNGEKSNVALLIYRQKQPCAKHKTRLTSLKTLPQPIAEQLLSSRDNCDDYTHKILQCKIYENADSRFDMVSSQKLRDLVFSKEKYGDFAVPMQGTSTGDAKNLIDFWWNHIGDSNWIPVSKGGGYSRWSGLNFYCVKWGANGEFIKATKGSAIRNATYFSQTELVYSDTGTSGLNVRKLLPGQIFVASGPGIRILDGDSYSHLAFLNSRFSSYYIRLLSPKFTIAAGYIAKLPIVKAIISSNLLSEYGKQCFDAKNRRLKKRVCNFEFVDIDNVQTTNIEKCAYSWFIEDIEDEWMQLYNEQLSETLISSMMNLSNEDLLTMDTYIGEKNVLSNDKVENIVENDLKDVFSKSLDANCNVIRTKSDKVSLGCDGIIEFASQKMKISCEAIYKFIVEKQFFPPEIKNKYINLYIHAIAMSALNYKNEKISFISLKDLLRKMPICSNKNRPFIEKWFKETFNYIHTESFFKSPIYKYDQELDLISYIGGEKSE